MIVLNAYEIDDDRYGLPTWEITDPMDHYNPPDILDEDEFGDWINDPEVRRIFDIRIFTLAAYYTALAREYANVD